MLTDEIQQRDSAALKVQRENYEQMVAVHQSNYNNYKDKLDALKNSPPLDESKKNKYEQKMALNKIDQIEYQKKLLALTEGVCLLDLQGDYKKLAEEQIDLQIEYLKIERKKIPANNTKARTEVQAKINKLNDKKLKTNFGEEFKLLQVAELQNIVKNRPTNGINEHHQKKLDLQKLRRDEKLLKDQKNMREREAVEKNFYNRYMDDLGELSKFLLTGNSKYAPEKPQKALKKMDEFFTDLGQLDEPGIKKKLKERCGNTYGFWKHFLDSEIKVGDPNAYSKPDQLADQIGYDANTLLAGAGILALTLCLGPVAGLIGAVALMSLAAWADQTNTNILGTALSYGTQAIGKALGLMAGAVYGTIKGAEELGKFAYYTFCGILSGIDKLRGIEGRFDDTKQYWRAAWDCTGGSLGRGFDDFCVFAEGLTKAVYNCAASAPEKISDLATSFSSFCSSFFSGADKNTLKPIDTTQDDTLNSGLSAGKN